MANWPVNQCAYVATCGLKDILDENFMCQGMEEFQAGDTFKEDE
jgi:hypothetical protein